LFALENTAYVFSDSKPRHHSRVSPVQVSRIASSCVLTNYLLHSLIVSLVM